MEKPFKLKSGNKISFKEMGSSPAKGKGDNLYRIMSERKAFKKKTGTWYKPGAEPKVKVPNVKGFNVKGDSWPDKTPGFEETKIGKAQKASKSRIPKMDMTLNENLNKAVRGTKKKVVKKSVKKGVSQVAKQVGKRLLGPIGVGIAAYDVIKTAPKVAKATKKGLKKRAKSGNVNIGRKL